MGEQKASFDVFLAHASEDRDEVVVPLVDALRKKGVSVWYSELESAFDRRQTVSDKQLRSYLQGAMQSCRLGCLVVSQTFLSKPWPMMELYHLVDKFEEDRLFIILHKTSLVELSAKINRDAAYLRANFTIVESATLPAAVAEQVTSRVPRRTTLTMRRCLPPSDIVVFPEIGAISLGTSGGLFPKGHGAKLDFIDFAGRDITNKADRVMSLATSILERAARKSPDSRDGEALKLSGVPFRFEREVRYAHLNHLHIEIFTPRQIELGCALNVGTNEHPYVVTPFYTCEAFTAGIIEDMTPRSINECLRIARGSWRGNWKRIITKEDRTFFVVGDED